MTRWERGQAEVDAAIASRELQHISGAAANGEPLIDKAARTLASAEMVLETDADTAYVLAYDTARFCCTALLAQQGLRPTTSGGHYVVERIVRAQFGAGFSSFGVLRRRRNELEYPTDAGDLTTRSEAEAALADARSLLAASGQLLPNVGFY